MNKNNPRREEAGEKRLLTYEQPKALLSIKATNCQKNIKSTFKNMHHLIDLIKKQLVLN